MNPAVDSALQLRDIHLPTSPSLWPPAPGWWVLAIAALVVLAWLGLRLATRLRDRRETAAIVAELHHIVTAENLEDTVVAAAISALLKRLALSRYPRVMVASLSGEEWLKFLDDHSDDEFFASATSRVLVDAAYRPSAKIDRSALANAAENWIKKQRSTAPC